MAPPASSREPRSELKPPFPSPSPAPALHAGRAGVRGSGWRGLRAHTPLSKSRFPGNRARLPAPCNVEPLPSLGTPSTGLPGPCAWDSAAGAHGIGVTPAAGGALQPRDPRTELGAQGALAGGSGILGTLSALSLPSRASLSPGLLSLTCWRWKAETGGARHLWAPVLPACSQMSAGRFPSRANQANAGRLAVKAQHRENCCNQVPST
ncbi:uncharacterized protein LOC119524999 [Choloepus didactylus]|uniref:uncharacterized protein LOC119524999 n=1 Tax=Choloepus didactylus TaxID=27675 RepID=UPI00189F7AA0|nr:uncharacterized protein LOC119524999 [Choloepus didactylus]